MARISSATSRFMLWWARIGGYPCASNSVDQFQMNLHLTKTNHPVTTSPISSLVLPVAELCNERRLSQPSLPELSCSWLVSCDPHRHRTCSLCVLIDAQLGWLYASFHTLAHNSLPLSLAFTGRYCYNPPRSR
jgi:hypothetical protein